MSIAKKIFISVGILTLIVIGVSIFSYNQLSNTNDEYTELINIRLEQIYTAADLQSRVGVQGVNLRQYVLTGEDNALSMLRDEQRLIDENIVTLEKTVVTDEMRALTIRLQDAKAAFDEAAVQVEDAIKAKNTERAIELLKTSVRNANVELNDASQEMLEYNKEKFAQASAKTDTDVRQMSIVLIIISIVSAIIGIVTLRIMTRLIAKPLQQLATDVDMIANGDLTVADFTVRTKDEVAVLGNAFNKMKASLRQLIEAAQDNANELSNIARELNASTTQVGQTSSQVADNVGAITAGTVQASQIANDTSVAMDETATGVQNIAASTQDIHTQAQDTQSIASDGERAIEEAKEQMQSIYNSSKLTTQLIQKLSKSSEEIQNITNVITDITDQTNLLALNAAIEAARAGEHGKGFAVVADEVRKLAEQSKESANSITALTTDIMAETKRVEVAVTDGLMQVETGVKVIDKAGLSFTNITGAVSDITTRVAEVSAVTEEISAATEEVSASVNELSSNIRNTAQNSEQITQQVEEQVASIQEINAITENLEKKSVELSYLISHFKL